MSVVRTVGAGALTVLVGCTETDMLRETGDLGYTGPYAIESVQRTCTPDAPDAWSFDVRTEGWAHAVDLVVLEPASGATETHPLANVDYDTAGTWDQWQVTLLAVTSDTAAQAGATTAWGCADAGSLAWQVVMYAPDAPDSPADCAVWGPQASLALAGPADLACHCVEEDNDCTN